MKEKNDVTGQELEYLADQLLREVPFDKEYPYYTDEDMRKKIRRDRRVLPKLAKKGLLPEELYCTMSQDVVAEAKLFLADLGRMTKLSEIEEAILGLILLGMTHEEVSESLSIPIRTLYWKLAKLRKHLVETIPPGFWDDLWNVYIYTRPSICCNPGMEVCKSPTGQCPYHKTASPRS